jgi:hypothetical protein
MNDEQLQPLLEAWLRKRETPRPKVQAGVARVMANVPRTRQQRRWWPRPAIRPTTRTSTATDTAENRLRPIPASNGHAPTLLWRTQTMFSPVNAIAAGAIIFVLGGVYLIAQPFDQQRQGVPGAETTDLAEPVPFTAVFGSGSGQGTPATCEQIDGVNHCLDSRPSMVITEASDPRLSGTLTASISSVQYPDHPAFVTVTYRIYNADGTWQGAGTTTRTHGEANPPLTVLLVGERAYEGLYAWMDATDWDVASGVIFPDPPPEPTDLAPAG